jgi:hypothetical protein
VTQPALDSSWAAPRTGPGTRPQHWAQQPGRAADDGSRSGEQPDDEQRPHQRGGCEHVADRPAQHTPRCARASRAAPAGAGPG